MEHLFGDKLKKIILYGSYAKNKQNKESDIDFFVLVDDTEENLRNTKYRITDIMTKLSLNYDKIDSTWKCFYVFLSCGVPFGLCPLPFSMEYPRRWPSRRG